MKINYTLLTILAGVGLSHSAVISVTTTLLTNSQDNPGTALIDLTPGSAAASGTSLALPGLAIGDGTAEEYRFVNSAGINDATAGTLNTYTSLGSNISAPTFTANSLTGSDEFAFVTDSTGASFIDDTGSRAADVSFTVDTSSYDTGVVYVVFGTFQDDASVSATDGTVSLTSDVLGGGGSLASTGTAIAAFNFDNLVDGGAAPILSFQQVNADADGSRARFYGIIVDAEVEEVIPEPTSTALLGLGGLALIGRRRRR